ncbi:GNAT family N-acetyltransferase [Aquibacillus koreensis]|uniref:GNAT family N-acetyltransferase n=1 Tax=Aquibacillus koreensis TaxID=279446 RepID=A0A9X3WI58_9BACI|nr:GNAT family N-acetyltransferase [Aquibacillus koreensis]MCT2536514.1 GNAT family N-acetyltransferase [Aquibacillus koreensis]MDC3419398.1 GNAT family N-acetyltransferase [Aquibacillus koreensis]
MEHFEFRQLTAGDCHRLRDIDASQYIKNAWREVDGERKLIAIDYHDKGWPNGYDAHHQALLETIENSGIAIGAFDQERKLVGFASMNRELFGEKYKYVLLDQLFITVELRGKGIGSKLFMLVAEVAKQWEAERLYICAGSAEDTIQFYHSIGCREAEEINKELYESDPRDVQLEYVL